MALWTSSGEMRVYCRPPGKMGQWTETLRSLQQNGRDSRTHWALQAPWEGQRERDPFVDLKLLLLDSEGFHSDVQCGRVENRFLGWTHTELSHVSITGNSEDGL